MTSCVLRKKGVGLTVPLGLFENFRSLLRIVVLLIWDTPLHGEITEVGEIISRSGLIGSLHPRLGASFLTKRLYHTLTLLVLR